MSDPELMKLYQAIKDLSDLAEALESSMCYETCGTKHICGPTDKRLVKHSDTIKKANKELKS